MSAKNFTSVEERKRRLEGVQHALLVFGDGKEHSARELFERPENATNASVSGYTKADLAWQTKALSTLHDLGLIVRTGAHGPTRKYKLAEGADIDPYLSDEGAASLIWATGIDMFRTAPEESEPVQTEAPFSSEPPEGASDASEEESVPSMDPSQALLSKLLLVLEGFDERLRKLDERITNVSGSAPTLTSLATRDDLGEAAVQILQFLEPRLAKLERQVASSVEAQLSLPAVDLRTITPALDAIGKRALDMDDRLRELQTDMRKQVNRTQDVATKQVVDKKRFDDFCRRIDEVLDACDRVIGYNVRLITSLRVMVDGPVAETNDAVLSPLLKKERSG